MQYGGCRSVFDLGFVIVQVEFDGFQSRSIAAPGECLQGSSAHQPTLVAGRLREGLSRIRVGIVGQLVSVGGAPSRSVPVSCSLHPTPADAGQRTEVYAL